MEPKNKKIIYCVDFLAISLDKHYILVDVDNDWYTEIQIPITTQIVREDKEYATNLIKEKAAEWLWPMEENFDIVFKDLNDFYDVSGDIVGQRIFKAYIDCLKKSLEPLTKR